MVRTGGPEASSSPSPMRRSVDSFLEAKLHAPPAREEWVERGRLLDQLDRVVVRPIVLVAAPAGFGKTTLLAQWLTTRRARSATAWVTLDPGDNDPVRLWTHVAAALQRANCALGPDAGTFVAANSDEIMTGVLSRLLRALAAMPDDIVIVLDDFHFLREPACHDQVEFLVEHLPPQCHLLIATRSDPGLRLGRLRVSGRLGEIRATDLAFSDEETAALLALQQIELPGPAVAQLVTRTEGWPAGLYLATLSLSGRADREQFVREFSGSDRFVGDYLTEEVLGGHPDQMREFITTVSILDRLCAPLCDFIAETTGSAATLHELERTNMFLVPLDEHSGWYRFHHLFATAARSELAIKHPDRVASLHARAATWFRDHGHIEEAIKHLLEADNSADASLLVQANWLKYVNAGRAATVVGWLSALGPASLDRDPAARVTAAWMAALSGDEAALAAHVEALHEFADYGPLPDGTHSVESAVAMIQALFGFGGPVEMAAAARRAVVLETDGRSPYYALAILALGHAAYIDGDLGLAESLLTKVMHNEAAPAIAQVLSVSTLSLVGSENGHRDRALLLAEQSMDIVETSGLHAASQASLALTALAQVQADAGNITDAMATVDRGLAMHRRNPTLASWTTMHHLLVAARVAVDARELSMARELLDEVGTLMDRFPVGMEQMRARLAAVQRRVPSQQASAALEVLTGREAEVLRLLQGSLNLTEIAGELYVSHNTVKTHTRTLYRKLGARSRAEAVRIARSRLLV